MEPTDTPTQRNLSNLIQPSIRYLSFFYRYKKEIRFHSPNKEEPR